MLGAFGFGAIVGALGIGEVSKRMTGEAAARACTLSMGGAVAAVALSHAPILTTFALVFAGATWTMSVTLFNIGIHGAALGSGSFACGVPCCDFRRHRHWRLGVGLPHRCCWCRDRAARIFCLHAPFPPSWTLATYPAN